MISQLGSLFLVFSLLAPTWAGASCHHDTAAQQEAKQTPCHDHGHEGAESQTSSKPSSLTTKVPTHCMMCATGRCWQPTSVLATLHQDQWMESAPKAVTPSLPSILRLTWRFLLPQLQRPPPLKVLLPAVRHWQAFYSVFRN